METTTVSKLTEGSRVLVALDPDTGTSFATDPATARTAEVRMTGSEGRRRVIVTDLGEIVAGPTAKVILAPPVEEAAPEADPDPIPAPAGILAATVNLDALGRVTPDSVVMVGERSTVVRPEAGDNAPDRLRAALAELGYEPVTRWAAEDGAAVCQARPVHP